MAQYTHLTIYQKSYDLLLRIYKEVHKFPKEYKYSLGQQVQTACLDLLDQIIIANSEQDKKPYLSKANKHIDRLRIYIRLCHNLQIITFKKYEILSRFVDEIGKMLGGWIKSSQN